MTRRKGLSLGNGVGVGGVWIGLGIAMQSGHYPCLFVILGTAISLMVIWS